MLVAYIDPGLGALLWQAIMAAVVGFLFYLKKTRQWIAGLFRKIFGRNRTNLTVDINARVEDTVPVEGFAAEVDTKADAR